MAAFSRLPLVEGDFPVLRARARALAQLRVDGASAPTRSIVVVTTGVGRLGFDAGRVREVLAPGAVTRLPRRRGSAMVGVRNVRGGLLPLTSVGSVMSLPEQEAPSAQWVVVVDAPEPLGILVDGAEALVSVTEDEWQRLHGPGPTAMRLVAGVTSAGVSVVDVDALLAHPAVSVSSPDREMGLGPEVGP